MKEGATGTRRKERRRCAYGKSRENGPKDGPGWRRRRARPGDPRKDRAINGKGRGATIDTARAKPGQ